MNSFKDYFVIARDVEPKNFDHSSWQYTEYNILRPNDNSMTYYCIIDSPKYVGFCSNSMCLYVFNSRYINYIDEFDVTNIMEFLRGDKTFDGM